MSPIQTNLQGVKARCHAAIAGRNVRFQEAVSLVAVSKTKSDAEVREAFAAGQLAFGENYVQEGVKKALALADLAAHANSERVGAGIEWHLIGPLQSNKARLAAESFDWVQTVDRQKIAEALSRHRHSHATAGLKPLNVLVQVNVSGEASKSGALPADAAGLAAVVAALPGLRLRGLMAVVENTRNEVELRAQFRVMRGLFDGLRQYAESVDTLSMGMSGDFEIAIEEGATMVRVGSAIFGARNVQETGVAA